MKKIEFNFVCFLLIISMLFGCTAVPVIALDDTDTSGQKQQSALIDEESFRKTTPATDGNLSLQEKEILKADDKIISEESKILRYVDSAQFNAANHVSRLTELEGLNSYVFANADGTRTVYFMDENVKYKDVDGNIEEKDITLVSKADGFKIKESNIALFIPKSPTSGIEVSYANYDIKLIPQTADCKIKTTTKDNSVVYENAFGNGVSLLYTPLLSGIKEDIVLSKYVSNASFTFILETDGLMLYKDDYGHYLANTDNGKPLLCLSDIVVYDAVGKIEEGNINVTPIESGKKYSVTVSVNNEFLSDPETVYPVVIDPSITVSDEIYGKGAIEDSTVFEGYPARNYGGYHYNRIGMAAGAYGLGRTAVKFPGLISTNEYQTITANQITNVSFYAKEATGGSSQFINIYPLTNTTWTESTVKWNNIGTFSTAVNFGAAMVNNQWTAFNITELVKGWKNGTYSADAGFIMTNEDEVNNNKSFCSAEHSTVANRPYVTMTYIPDVVIYPVNIDIPEEETYTLTATTYPNGMPITWNTSNSTVATVSSTGVVTAHKAGYATITATTVDSDGVSYSATCNVTVYIPNGVYFIQNSLSELYLTAQGGKILDFTNVWQFGKLTTNAQLAQQMGQRWKIYYLGNGKYSVRPLHKLNMGLHVTESNTDIYSLGTTDTISGIPTIYALWTIEWYSSGYVFKQRGIDNYSLQIENSSTANRANVNVGMFSNSNSTFIWNLTRIYSPPAGILMYSKATGEMLYSATKYIAPEESRTLDDMNLEFAFYSGTTINQDFQWTRSNDNLSFNSTNGAIIGEEPGNVTVGAYVYYEGITYTKTYDVIVTEIANGTYLLQNKQTKCFADIANRIMASGTTVCQWQINGDKSQKWNINHLGDGYYSISSCNSNVKYYLGVENDSTVIDDDIILRSENITTGMKWKFEKISSDSYVIIPKTTENSDGVLATTTSQATNGAKLIQGDYIDNSSYRDEWFLLRQMDYTLMYIGNVSNDPLMPPIINAVSDSLYTNANMYGNNFVALNTENALAHLSSSTIFSCITHGSQTSIATTNGELTVTMINNMSDNAFDDLYFVYLGACYTGQGGLTASNLVNAIYDKGADNTLGFIEYMPINETNIWTQAFMIALSMGYSIAESMQAADDVIDNNEDFSDKRHFTEEYRYFKGSYSAKPCDVS